ncbi:MAG: hypothetical protein V4523_18305 [Pseudomonadota bacterium]
MLAQGDPEARRVRQQVLAHLGYVQEAFAVASELCGQQRIMQDGQRREVLFVQDFVDRIKFVGGVAGPIEGFGGLGDEVAL